MQNDRVDELYEVLKGIYSNNKNICLSGGADGADLAWGRAAMNRGDFLIHWTFEGHWSKAPENTIIRLDDEFLQYTNQYLEDANIRLKRRIPYNKPKIANLLRRNYYQVCWSNAVYAISTIKKGQVQGGTAWAIAMAQNIPLIDIYVFDQDDRQWFYWDDEWLAVGKPNPPEGVWAGIGCRAINKAGRQAIAELM